MKDPQGDDLTFFSSVREAQLCAKNIKDLERWIDTGNLQPEDFSHEFIQRSGIIPVVTMDDEYTAKVLTAPKVNRYNLVELYLRGFMVFEDNLEGLTMNKNNVEKAIEARKPTELELTIPILTAAIQDLGMANIKQAQDELLTMFQQRRNKNADKRQAAVSAIPALTNVLQIHQKICELTIANIVRKQNLQKSINIASIRDVEKLLASETEKLNQIQGQGIMGQTHPRLADLTSLRNFILEKERTDKILEGPEPVPFWELPNWVQEIYPKEAFPKRLEMLSQLLQQNLLAEYSEALTSETEIESCPEYQELLDCVSSLITDQHWEDVSFTLYFYFLKCNVNEHCAMKIYYQNHLNPILEPLDMRDAHTNLKNVKPPGRFKMQYDTILQNIDRRTIQDILKDIRDEKRIPDKSFSSQLEQALEPVVNRKSNTLLNILEGFIETLGASPSFRKIRDGLLSRKEQGDYDAICGFLDLEREQHDKQYLDALKGVLRKYIADFDKKREDELTRQMIELIEKKFAGLNQMVKSKEYNDLIKEIDQLQPREITPTCESGLYYQKKCTELIPDFQQALILQSKEDMGKLVKQLPMSSEDFSEKMSIFQKSLDLEKRFYLILPGLDQKIQALNDKGQQMFFDNNMNLANPIYTEFVHRVNVYMENLSGRYPVDDANWTQSMQKLCILCAQFPSGEFESLRNKIHAHFSDIIKSDLKKRYKMIIEDRNILRNFQDEEEGNGGQRPAHTFKQLMLSINQTKTNVEKMLADQVTSSLGDLDIIVKRFTQYIAKSIREYLESLFNKELSSLLNETSTKDGSSSTPNFDIEGIQAALNLIESFASSAIQFQFNEIADELKNYSNFIVESGAKAFEELQKNFCGLLESQEPQSQEIRILEHTDIQQIYDQVISLRKISHIKLAASKYFAQIQKKVLQIVKIKSISIKNTMTLVEKGEHSSYSTSKKMTFFKDMLQVVKEYGYFQGILEQDQQQEANIKMEMQTIFDGCMEELYGKIHLHQVKDPKHWKEVLKVGVIVDDFNQIKEIFAEIGLITNQTHYDNVRESFKQAVSTAMKTINESLRQPVVFMTRGHYQDFSIYQKYLQILQENKNIFLPDEEQQKDAKMIVRHLKLIVKKQIQQLEETFNYRFRRYLFSDQNEPNKYFYHKRPSPIQFSLEEIKAQSDSAEVADQINLDERLDQACKEIYSLIEVTYWLIEQFIFEERLTQESSSSLMRDFLSRLKFDNIKYLYSLFKKSLLETFFDGFDMRKERLIHEIKRNESLFHHKYTVVKYLRHVDKFFKLQSLVNYAESLTSLEVKAQYIMFFNDINNEVLKYESIAFAQKSFEDELSKEARDDTTKFKIQYHQKQYKILSEILEPQVEFIKIEMANIIKQESDKLLNLLRLRIQDFQDTLCETQEICETVLYLDAHIQFLPEYVNAKLIEDKIKEAICQLEDKINETFQSINDLSLKYQFDQVFKKLFAIDAMIKKMQNSSQSSKLDFLPSRDSFTEFYNKLLKLIKDKKASIMDSFKKCLQDYDDAIPMGLGQLKIVQKTYGCTSASIIDLIEKLEQKQLLWSDTNTQISSFISSGINKFQSSVELLRPESATEQTQLDAMSHSISELREILKFLPQNYFGHLTQVIENKSEAVKNQKQKIMQNQIILHFNDKNFDGIAKAIRENPEVIDEKLTENLKQKFNLLIQSECEDGQKIVCAEQVQREVLLKLMNEKVPKITQFLLNDCFNPFILEKCHNDFQKKLRQSFTYLYNYAFRYILKRIEWGSKAIPSKDISLKQERGPNENLKLKLEDYKVGLEILDDINHSESKHIIIEGYNEKLPKFIEECCEIIKSLIKKWKEAIETNNAQQIIILIDDIIADENIFQDGKFKKTFEIDYDIKQPGKDNFELVEAVRNNFRGKQPKQLLHQWGKDQLKQLEDINFAKKYAGQHQRGIDYSKFIKIYTDLEEVTKKAKTLAFFVYESEYFCYSETAQQKMIKKVGELKSQFRILFSDVRFNGPKYDFLSQNKSEELESFFQKIISSYLNLQSIIEQFQIIEAQMLEEIQQILDEFRNKLSARIDGFVEEAKVLSEKSPENKESFIDLKDLKRIAAIIIEIQLIKNNFSQIKDDIQNLQSKIIDNYNTIQQKRSNKAPLQNLMSYLEGQDWGAQSIKECKAFEKYLSMDLQRKLNTKNIEDVLKQITGEDISLENKILKITDNFKEIKGNSQITGKTLLHQEYNKFKNMYQAKLKQQIAVRNQQKHLNTIHLDNLVKEIIQFKDTMNKCTWNKQNIEKIPQLLSLIFALWSLMRPEELQKEQNSEEEKAGDILDYIIQPHPAQVVGLMRILGIGYSPQGQDGLRNNLVQIKTGEGKSVTLAVLSIVFALCDFDVRCGCYSAYLSERDFKAFEPMFNKLGLKDQIKYNTFHQICEMEINKSGNLREIIQSIVLYNPIKLVVQPDYKEKPQVLLIDEVDVFFSDNFFGNTYMPLAQIKGVEVEALTDYIWKNRNTDLTIEKVSDTVEYNKVLQMFKVEYAFLLIEAVKQMIVDLLDVKNFKLGIEVAGMNMMDIIEGQIMYKVGDSWSPNVRVSYCTMFAYYHYYDFPQPGKDKIKLEDLKNNKAIGINITELSFAEIPLRFPILLGVTGTLDTLSDEQQKIMNAVYNFKSKTYVPSAYDIPVHLRVEQDKIKGLKEEILIINKSQYDKNNDAPPVYDSGVITVIEMGVTIIKGKEQFFEKLTSRIRELKVSKNQEKDLDQNQRAVIVFFKSEEILNEFMESSNFDESESSKLGILTEKSLNSERDSAVKNATFQGRITLATREFGRGTDFQYFGNAVKYAGGLAVIQAFFTSDYSEEIQIRGRTRRQGTTGSYEIIVCQQDLIDHFGLEDNFVDGLSINPSDAFNNYIKLHDKSIKEYEQQQKHKQELRDNLMENHYKYIKNLEYINRSVKGIKLKEEENKSMVQMLVDLNQCQQYNQIFRKRIIKTLVLIDATGSMGALLQNVKDTIILYFKEVCQACKVNNYDKNLFKIQIAFYRNYNDGENILKVSPWVGAEQEQTLQNFVNEEKASGGTNIAPGNEAIEIAFWHANQEIKKPSDDGEPVSLIFVIGDMPSNTKQEILRLKYNCKDSVNPSITDEDLLKIHGYKSPWDKNLQAKYGSSTTWDIQLESIKSFIDNDGFNIPVQSFYVNKSNIKVDDMETFYDGLRANIQEDQGRLLNLANKNELVINLCSDTIKMIAKKNPKSGNRQGMEKYGDNIKKIGIAQA